MALKKDENFNVTNTLDSDPPGGYHRVAGADLTEDLWYRLVPSGDDGAKVTGDRNQINIGTLRADVQNTNFNGWKFKILNPSHNIPVIDVSSITNAGICTLSKEPEYYDALPDSSIEWVLYPNLLFPFAIVKDQDDGLSFELGIVEHERFATTAAEVRKIYKLYDEDFSNGIELRTTEVWKLFFRTTETPGVKNLGFYWGEFSVEIG